MFGIYELLAIFSFISLGYKAFFYAILGILTHDVSYRIGTEPALWVGSVGLFLIEILGVVNTAFFIGLVITCFWSRQLLAWVTARTVTLQARLATIPQGQKLMMRISIVTSFTGTVLRFLAGTSYIKPFTSLDGWATLAATCRDRLVNAQATAYTLSTTVIYNPLIEMGGVRAERIIGCWFTIRREIITQITIYRVSLAQTLIQCKQYYPVVVAGFITMKDNPQMMKGMMGGMGMGMPMAAAPQQVTARKEVGDDTMDMMRDFIQTTEATQSVVAPTVSATTTTSANTITAKVSSAASTNAQRAAVEAAAAALPATEAIPEAQKAQLKTMLLNTLAAQNIKWDKLNKTQRAMYVRRFDTMLAASGADFKGFSVGEILWK
jgi:hypothetical protein